MQIIIGVTEMMWIKFYKYLSDASADSHWLIYISAKLDLSEKKKCFGNNYLVIVWHTVWFRDR